MILTIGDGNVQEQLCRKAIFHHAKSKSKNLIIKIRKYNNVTWNIVKHYKSFSSIII